MSKQNRVWRRGLGNAFLTFVLTLVFSYLAEAILRRITILFLALLLLLLVIFIGVIFDMIGFAAAAADIEPLNARASNKVWGARQAVRLIKNADQVAVFCSDVMGDIASTIAGALGAVIIFRLLASKPGLSEGLLTTLMASLIASVSVGGKALGKGLALREATEIIFRLGQLLAWVEKITGYQFFSAAKGEKVKKK
jgi:CBS domain containing-hemolysin-like protein